jgi:hypothetical protein
MSDPNRLPSQSLASEVLGTEPEDNGMAAILKAYANLTGRELTRDEYRERFNDCQRLAKAAGDEDVDMYKLDPDTRDDLVTMYALESFFETEKTFGNNLMDWPLYQTLYRQRVHSSEFTPLDRQQRNALLLGSLSLLSSHAFTHIATTVYNATPFVVDLESSDMSRRKLGNAFVQGDVLHLPFQDNTMDVIQTNQLLHMLRSEKDNNSGEPDIEDATQLLQEAFRVLRPDGYLLMHEVIKFDPTDRDYQLPHNQAKLRKFGAGIHGVLRSIGFGDLSITRATRHEGVDFLFDAEQKFEAYPVKQKNGLAVVAQKP